MKNPVGVGFLSSFVRSGVLSSLCHAVPSFRSFATRFLSSHPLSVRLSDGSVAYGTEENGERDMRDVRRNVRREGGD